MKGNVTSAVITATDKFDVVIRTQSEFNTLVASPTWLNATSVCFVGDGGNLTFYKTVTGLKVPNTVKQIQGMNNAIIEVAEFRYNSTTNKAALWYAIRPTTDDYSIQNLTVTCTGDNAYVFYSCTKLTNCTGAGTGRGGYDSGYGFINCTQLINCTGISIGSTGVSFEQCDQLTNCTGTGTGEDATGIGFDECTQLINCTGTGNGTDRYAIGFRTCTQLTNCTGIGTGECGEGFSECTQLTNCTGTGTGTGTGTSGYSTGYGFYGCNWINGCKQGTTGSSTSFLGGTNTKVDTLTVIAV